MWEWWNNRAQRNSKRVLREWIDRSSIPLFSHHSGVSLCFQSLVLGLCSSQWIRLQPPFPIPRCYNHWPTLLNQSITPTLFDSFSVYITGISFFFFCFLLRFLSDLQVSARKLVMLLPIWTQPVLLFISFVWELHIFSIFLLLSYDFLFRVGYVDS